MRIRTPISAWLAWVLLALSAAASAQEPLRLATGTSAENSGLLSFLLPSFEQWSHVKVDLMTVGSGQALKLAESGDADAVFSHAPELEEAFLKAGFGVNRRDVMYDDFIIAGPPGDPAHLRGALSAVQAFKMLTAAQAPFISRGDESGTHQKEKALWKAAGIAPSGTGYVSAARGMAEVLLMAGERQAYTLTDRATFRVHKGHEKLAIVFEGDPILVNPYTITAVNPARFPRVKYLEAMQLIGWLTSPEGQRLISSFKLDGEALFHPSAIPVPK